MENNGNMDYQEENNASTDVDNSFDTFKHENGKIFGKFDNVESALNGYRNLEKEFHKTRQSIEKAPDEYDIKLNDEFKDIWRLEKDDPMLNTFLPKFKEWGLSNEKANEIVNTFISSKVSEIKSVQEEIAKLGSEGKEILSSIDNFGKKNFGKEESELLNSLVGDAETAKLIGRLVKMAEGNNKIPAESSKALGKSKEEILQEAFEYEQKHSATIGSNPSQQEHYFNLMKKAVDME